MIAFGIRNRKLYSFHHTFDSNNLYIYIRIYNLYIRYSSVPQIYSFTDLTLFYLFDIKTSYQ